MDLVTLEEAKAYLRVDSDYDDALIGTLLESAITMCLEVSRLSDEDIGVLYDSENAAADVERNRWLLRAAVLYTVAFLYEHREDGDYHALSLMQRSILSPIREGVV